MINPVGVLKTCCTNFYSFNPTLNQKVARAIKIALIAAIILPTVGFVIDQAKNDLSDCISKKRTQSLCFLEREINKSMPFTNNFCISDNKRKVFEYIQCLIEDVKSTCSMENMREIFGNLWCFKEDLRDVDVRVAEGNTLSRALLVEDKVYNGVCSVSCFQDLLNYTSA